MSKSPFLFAFNKIRVLFLEHYPFALFLILTFFPFSSSIIGLLPFSINRVLAFFLFVIIGLKIIFAEYKNPFYISAIIFLVFVFVNTTINSFPLFSENTNDFIYFGMTIFTFLLCLDLHAKKSIIGYFKKYRLWVFIFVMLSLLMFVISYFFDSSYEANGAFAGFTKISHAVGAVCVLNCFLLLKSNYRFPIWYFPSAFFIYKCKARTFLLLFGLFVVYYIFTVFKNKKIASVITIVSIVLLSVIIPFSPIGEKFVEAMSQWYRNHPIDALSNGRSLIWTDNINAFFNNNFYYQLFGKSFSFIKDVTSSDFTGARLWAHNDFIESINSVGIFGLSFYLFSFCVSLYGFSKKGVVFAILLFVISAMLNGYMLYYPLSLTYFVLSVDDNSLYEKMMLNHDLGKKDLKCVVIQL